MNKGSLQSSVVIGLLIAACGGSESAPAAPSRQNGGLEPSAAGGGSGAKGPTLKCSDDRKGWQINSGAGVYAVHAKSVDTDCVDGGSLCVRGPGTPAPPNDCFKNAKAGQDWEFSIGDGGSFMVYCQEPRGGSSAGEKHAMCTAGVTASDMIWNNGGGAGGGRYVATFSVTRK